MVQILPTCQEDAEDVLDCYDRLIRALRNANISAVYFRIYCSLVDTYPQVLTGERTPINDDIIRENAGNVSTSSITKFWVDMAAIEACHHEPGSRGISSYVTVNTDLFPFPEYLDTRNSEQRRKERKAAREREQAQRAALIVFNCEECGSPDIKYDLLPICKSCGHKHAVMAEVSNRRLSIEPELVDGMEGFQEPSEQPVESLPALRLVRNPETPRPAAAEPTPPAFACLGCGKREYRLPLSRDRWLCVNCGKAYTLYIGNEVSA